MAEYYPTFAILLLWYLIKTSTVTQESLLLLPPLGLQITTHYHFNRTKSKFITTDRIMEIIINEGIKLWEIRFYLAVIVEGEDKLIVLFENLLPPLDTLETIYRGNPIRFLFDCNSLDGMIDT
ncbi:GPI-GlcNAc transferase complex, PIG-H component-domain-containing protein [Paraphysoderma sedebokerense]|nr:GPI-GlcNAc transferase complex, PIG-H component-domain-containing protein [Paraphysoderma sedebokerense]